MTWGPKDWIGWAGLAKSFFSSKGVILTKFVLSSDREGEFFLASIEDQEKHPLITPGFNGEAETLHGIPVMFTTKLPTERALFLSKPDPDAQ